MFQVLQMYIMVYLENAKITDYWSLSLSLYRIDIVRPSQIHFTYTLKWSELTFLNAETDFLIFIHSSGVSNSHVSVSMPQFLFQKNKTPPRSMQSSSLCGTSVFPYAYSNLLYIPWCIVVLRKYSYTIPV